jgi:hypothetical protein
MCQCYEIPPFKLPTLERLRLLHTPISQIPDSLCDQKPNILIYADTEACANSKDRCCAILPGCW